MLTSTSAVFSSTCGRGIYLAWKSFPLPGKKSFLLSRTINISVKYKNLRAIGKKRRENFLLLPPQPPPPLELLKFSPYLLGCCVGDLEHARLDPCAVEGELGRDEIVG